MLAAIRDASVGEGQRIRGAIQAIQSGRLYSEFARVALFESEGVHGGSSMYAAGQNPNVLNRFWFADLEDFDQRPVHSVKRAYTAVHYNHDARQSIKRFRSLGEGVSDVADRRHRLLSVDTPRLVESFGVNVVRVSADNIASVGNLYRIGGPTLGIYDRVWGLKARGQSHYSVPKRPMEMGLVIPEALDEVRASADVEAVLRHLRDRGLDHFAGELEYKKILIEEDPDELPIDLESARGFASFVSSHTLAGSPNVTVDTDGYVGLEWVVPDPMSLGSGERRATSANDDAHVWGNGHGVLGLWFLPDRMVRVYGTSGPVKQGVVRMRVNCTVTPSHVMNAIAPFMFRLGDV